MTIEILVNNAGPVACGQWSEMPVERGLALVRRNLKGALRMTKLFLPPMLARGRGRVLTTAWEVNSEPGPLAAVEQAAGAFLLTWSEALATELADTPITVTALGRDARHADPFSKTREPAPEEVAKTGYAGLMKKELLVVPGGRDRALAAAPRYFPAGAQARWGERSAVPAIAATDLKTAFCP